LKAPATPGAKHLFQEATAVAQGDPVRESTDGRRLMPPMAAPRARFFLGFLPARARRLDDRGKPL
jgi:hypothetical protein